MVKILALIIMASISCNSEDDSINSNIIPIEPMEFPEFVNGTFNFQDRERFYTLHIPNSFDGTQPTPLVIFLHGGLGNIVSAQNFTNFNAVSEENGFLMLYPQGGFESTPNRFVWADGRGLPPDMLGIDDVGFINALIEKLKMEFNINDRKVYLCGFSNGSFLAQRIAFEGNDQFAAIGIIGGTMNESLFNTGNPERAIPMIYIFGTTDPLVPFNGGFVSGNTNLEPVIGIENAVEFWVQNNNCQTELPQVELPNINLNDNSSVTLFEYIDGIDDSEVRFYQVNNGGHTWPGVPTPNETLGVVNLDIQASEELWEFFNQFELFN